MNNLKLRHLAAIPLIVFFVTACATRCTELQPAAGKGISAAALMKEKQDMADFEALQREREMERMSDKELARGIVYEPNR